MKRRKGFTLIELIMVILILGLLAAMLLPRFTDLSTKAQNAAEAGTVGAIRAGLAAYKAEKLLASPPVPADCAPHLAPGDGIDTIVGAAAPNSPVAAKGNEFFTAVLEPGFQVTSDWSKGLNNVYTYIPNGHTYTYTYNNPGGGIPATGKFE